MDKPAETPPPAPSGEAATHTGKPVIIVDDLHVTFRVLVGATTGKPGAASGAATATQMEEPLNVMQRFLRRRKLRTRHYRDVKAIRGISFTVNHGDVVGIIGSNGSGKSTLLRGIAGLVPATQGAIYANGQPTLLGVNAALIGDLSGYRNITLGCLAMGMTRRQVETHMDEIAQLSTLRDPKKGDFLELPMSTYSSGMAAKLRFAIAASTMPDILLIDEALATGDAAFQKTSKAKIKELRDKAAAVIIVSHALADVESNCNRAIWLEQGVIKHDGEVHDVLRAYKDSVN